MVSGRLDTTWQVQNFLVQKMHAVIGKEWLSVAQVKTPVKLMCSHGFGMEPFRMPRPQSGASGKAARPWAYHVVLLDKPREADALAKYVQAAGASEPMQRTLQVCLLH